MALSSISWSVRLFRHLSLIKASAYLLVVLCGITNRAHADAGVTITLPATSGEMVIDGQMDEPQWQDAVTLSLDYVTRPHENTAPPVKTTVKAIENGDTLYVAFIAEDNEPSRISAFYRDRDKIWSNDLVGLKLDTFNDSRLAYQFFANPLGIQADSIENEMTGRESDSWDAIWESKGRINPKGYVVEMAIPLRILNFTESDNKKIWGAEFIRYYPREERLRISNVPYDRNNACNLCQLGEISGFEQAKQGKNLALIPTLVLGKGRSRDPLVTQDWDDTDNEEIGLDVKWGITPEVSLQATLNPDFSQVESDVAQLSINNTFALFFNEKRPFFLENADYFSSNFNLVYTRNIAAPDFGAKVTGRKDSHTFGVFAANDETATFLVPGNLGSSIASIEDESVNVALRYRYDVSDDWSLGVINTIRQADDYHNYVVGFDSKYKFTDQDTLRVQWVESDTEYPEELFKDFCDDQCTEPDDFSETAMRLKKQDNFRGNAYRINYRHEERDWFFRADHFNNGRDFRADLGFVSRVDRISNVIGGGYIWYNENSWWNEFEISGDWDIHHNDAGELLEKEAQIEFSVNARWQSYFELGFETRDRVGLRQDPSSLAVDGNATMFKEDSQWLFFEMRPVSEFFFATFARYGDRIDVTNNRLGKETNIQPRFELSLGQHTQLNVRHTYRNMDVNGEQLFTANLTDARLTYQFDQRQMLRLIVVYSDIERNVNNYLDPTSVESKNRDVGTQLLYSYKVNPLTKFFIGYSDSGFQSDDVPRMTMAEQSVFMKVSYAWLN